MDRAQSLLNRQAAIHPEVWAGNMNGLRKKEEPLKRAVENGSEITEKMLNEFEVFVIKGEEKHKEFMGLVHELERRKAIFDSIAKHPDCPPFESGTGWSKSFEPLKTRFSWFLYSEDGKYIGPRPDGTDKLNKVNLGKINIDALTNLWSKKLPLIEKDKEKLQKQKKIDRDNVIKGLPGYLAKNSAAILADDDMKAKSERIQELISLISVDETHDLSEVIRLADEIKKQLNENTVTKEKKETTGKKKKCQDEECGEKVSHVFGPNNLCGDCFLDKELESRYKKLNDRKNAWGKVRHNRQVFRDFEYDQWRKFDDAYEDFQTQKNQESYNALMKSMSICEKTIPITEAEIAKNGKRSRSVSVEEESYSGDEEEEEEASFSSEEEQRKGKKRSRDDQEEDVVEEVLKTMVVATQADASELLEQYQKDSSTLMENLERVRKLRTVRHRLKIYFFPVPNGPKRYLPHPFSEVIYYRREEAEQVGTQYLSTIDPEASGTFFIEVEVEN
jgi:hypothetical protein